MRISEFCKNSAKESWGLQMGQSLSDQWIIARLTKKNQRYREKMGMKIIFEILVETQETFEIKERPQLVLAKNLSTADRRIIERLLTKKNQQKMNWKLPSLILAENFLPKII